ncbi:JAB domain-containing protein [Castellaniella caeni]|jgi:DNA repair protein RadC|uniref:JAB domain-containing protein n=1 Tax=Castellaniella TaxID=359336 RepID=UPI0008300A01|nr:JAB domain-containing protein [Castellaniella caeni]
MKTNSIAALSYDNMNDAHPLYVRSPNGRYKPATDDQILAAGRIAAESLIPATDMMGNPDRVAQFFQSKLAGLGHECAAFLYLDTQLKPIRYIEQGNGTLNHASIYPREIVKTALRLNSAALMMAHNHPSGLAEPSPADLALTRQLKQALALIDVRFLDHIIVSATETTSLASRGQM